MKDIKELPGIDRPREKMITGGASLLTDAELLAILLGFGSRDTPVLTLCDRVLRSVGNSLEQLSALSLDELCAIKGIGTAKATTILAAMDSVVVACKRKYRGSNRKPMRSALRYHFSWVLLNHILSRCY